jgi:hypothetical protein
MPFRSEALTAFHLKFFLNYQIGFGDLYITEDEIEPDLEKKQSRVSILRQMSMASIGQLETKFHRMRNFKTYLTDFVKCMTSDQIYKKQMLKRAKYNGVNSVSRCDKFARVFFPSLFILLNTVYWLRYLY